MIVIMEIVIVNNNNKSMTIIKKITMVTNNHKSSLLYLIASDKARKINSHKIRGVHSPVALSTTEPTTLISQHQKSKQNRRKSIGFG